MKEDIHSRFDWLFDSEFQKKYKDGPWVCINRQVWDIYIDLFCELYDAYDKLYLELFDNYLFDSGITDKLIQLVDRECEQTQANFLFGYVKAKGLGKVDIEYVKKMKILIFESEKDAEKYYKNSKGPFISYLKYDLMKSIYFHCFYDWSKIILDVYAKYRIIPMLSKKQIKGKDKMDKEQLEEELTKSMRAKKELLFKTLNAYREKNTKTLSKALRIAKNEPGYSSNSSDTEYQEMLKSFNEYKSFIEKFDPSFVKSINGLFLFDLYRYLI
jgi:hypothetical protein